MMDCCMAKLSAAGGIGASGRLCWSSNADAWQQSHPSVQRSFAFDDPSPAALQGALTIFTLATLSTSTASMEKLNIAIHV